MSVKTYAILDSSTPQVVINTVLWDADNQPNLNFGGYPLDLTNFDPKPSPPSYFMSGSTQVKSWWTYAGSQFYNVSASVSGSN